MNNIIKDYSAYTRSICILLVVTLLMGCGHESSKPVPDPLVGFRNTFTYDPRSHKTIEEDCANYLQTLPPEERDGAPREYFEDTNGQHAVRIAINVHGVNWWHVLIYDKDDHRIKTIKYATGHSQS